MAMQRDARPWGWRVTRGRKVVAHYFERLERGEHPYPYASLYSVCGPVSLRATSCEWLVYQHGGYVPLCPRCCAKLCELVGIVSRRQVRRVKKAEGEVPHGPSNASSS